MRTLALAAAVASILAACSSQVVNVSPDAGGTGGGHGNGTGPSGALVAACPGSPPTVGASCAELGLLCEYGDDLDWTCNVVTHCKPGGTWELATGGNPKCPSPALGVGPGCPASHPTAAKNQTCPQDNQVCAYPEGICVCQPGYVIGPGGPDASVPPSTWQCASPSAGCPPFRPRIGSACSISELSCDYGVCGMPSGSAYRCDAAGTWTDAFGGPCGGA